MKKVFIFVVCIFITTLTGCSSNEKQENKKNFTNEGREEVESIITLLKSNDISIDYYINYDSDNDLNESPEYIGKANFNDSSFSQTYDKKEPKSGSIEIFSDNDKAVQRREFLEENNATEMNIVFLKENKLLRLNKDMDERLILKYKTAFLNDYMKYIETLLELGFKETDESIYTLIHPDYFDNDIKAKLILFNLKDDVFFVTLENDKSWSISWDNKTATYKQGEKHHNFDETSKSWICDDSHTTEDDIEALNIYTAFLNYCTKNKLFFMSDIK